MKKISYNLRIGIVGNKNYHEEVFLDNIKDFAIAFNISRPYSDFFLIYEKIPIKLKIFSTETLEEIINNFDEIEKLDVIIFTVNLADTNSMNQYYKNILEEFNETYYFQGISILVGIDTAQIFKEKASKNIRVSRYSLKDMASYLNLIYCYEIYNKKGDVIEIFKKIFNDFVFRFRYSSSELFEQAKNYGNSLLKKNKKMIFL
jgi:hypothetical protein